MTGKPYAEVIGDPIAHSKSPTIHNFWLGKLGIDAEYRACHVKPDKLADYFASRNVDDHWRGCNVTMPHKQTVMPLMDELSPVAERIGAVNTVIMRDYYMIGDNTDGVGFMEPLRQFLSSQTYRFASLVGAGGAARAIADALASESFTLISYSRNPAKADEEIGRYIWDKDLLLPLSNLFKPCKSDEVIEADADRFDLLINASPLGMIGHDPLDIDLGWLPRASVVYDIVTTPVETDLLRRARAKGLSTIDGLAMLIGQAAKAFEKFFGELPPREHDAELRRLLTQ
ncbi:MAG: shikimate dehydrogenase [Novosphingobium sp.]|nr:shikimate dehydrogenase [Novosphingobium sp.]